MLEKLKKNYSNVLTQEIMKTNKQLFRSGEKTQELSYEFSLKYF